MGKRTKLYNRIEELYENIWDGVKNIPDILDFKFITKTLDYITTGTINILYTLDESVSSNNVFVRLERFNEKTPHYTLCFYKTNEVDLSKVCPVPVNDFGAYLVWMHLSLCSSEVFGLMTQMLSLRQMNTRDRDLIM